MSPFEVLMLICFGLSWPISIHKSFRTKKVTGKSPVFMGVVIIGYASGVVHKILFSMDWVIYLYLLNMAMVAIDMLLYFRYTGDRR
ncbi:MAG TPA: hypothetical protein VHO70_04190 [Chitinispirillaceae bacterium]|nr:hypothetical protein [Chitinispirillaceae bacterium]